MLNFLSSPQIKNATVENYLEKSKETTQTLGQVLSRSQFELTSYVSISSYEERCRVWSGTLFSREIVLLENFEIS